MDNIKILIDKEKLNDRVNILSKQIENDYKDKDLHIICVLKGSVFFTMEYKSKCQIRFCKNKKL